MEHIPGKIHVFLTGERGIGKSSAVRRAAELDGRPWHGFITGHPKVRVIEVTVDNRDKLPAAAAGELGKRKP